MPREKATVDIGLAEDKKQEIVQSLNTLLADETVLYMKTRNYHWNVVGRRFGSLHKLFEEQYDILAPVIDDVAENTRQFGGFATGTMTEFLQNSRLKEQPGEIPTEDGMLRNLLHDHENIIQSLREDIDKADDQWNAVDAADFLTGLLEKHNKMAWMLRAHLSE